MPTGEIIASSLQTLYNQIAFLIPNLIIALVVLILGWIIGSGLGSLAGKVVEILHVDNLANSLGMSQLSERVGRQLSIAALVRWLIKWFFIIATFVAAADILGLKEVSVFLYGEVIPYFGNVIVAIAILLIGMLAANFLEGVVRHSLQAGGLRTSDTLALITKWAIWVFAFLAALSELQVASAFVHDLFRAVIAMIAIAGGIAFGLGGKEHAKKVLDHIEKDVKRKE